MSTVWLVRHAESQANAGGRTSEPAQIELTPRGQEQARWVASLVTQPPDLVITSPYLRTKQTASPLIERFPTLEQAEWPIQEFTYLDPERCRNTTIQERKPLVAGYWERNDPFYVDGPGAESFSDLMQRISTLVTNLHISQDEFTIVFSHGQFIRSLLWSLFSNPVEITPNEMKRCRNFMNSFEIPNGALVKLDIQDERAIWISSVESSHIPVSLLTI